MRLPALILAAGLVLVPALSAAPATAQSWRDDHRNSGYGHQRGGSNWAPSAFDWRGQLDRPGDYRCDAFWDANRGDCGAAWRDQRHRTSRAAWNTGYGHDRYDQGYGYGRGHGYRRRGYGDAWSGGYGHDGGAAYYGAYGRPDVVYPGGARTRYANWSGGRDAGRVDWCRATYRSYDPASGYYRAYSGRLVWCG